MALATAAPQTQTAASTPPQIVQAAVISCFDPRIQEVVDKYRRDFDLNGGRSTPHHPPGATLNLEEEFPRLDLAVRLGAREIHALEHSGPACYAYRQRYGEEYDLDLHVQNLQTARRLLSERYPKIAIFTAVIHGRSIEAVR